VDTSAAGAKEEGFGRGRIPSEIFFKKVSQWCIFVHS